MPHHIPTNVIAKINIGAARLRLRPEYFRICNLLYVVRFLVYHGHMSHRIRSVSGSIVTGVIAGILLLPQTAARQLSYDPNEYCEDQGVYYRDGGMALSSTADTLQTVTGFDYAYVCNINGLHIGRLKRFPRFTRYGVTRGNVSYVPETIGTLTGLVRLQIHDQRITAVPASIGNLTRLEVLKLEGNALTSLPEELGNLTSLKVLHVYDNRLTMLPQSIGNLKSLETIDARDNRLTSLPDSIRNLQSLKLLYLGNNRFPAAEKIRIQRLLPGTAIYF